MVLKAEEVRVICVEATVGDGTHEDPCRAVVQFWDLDGRLLFTLDPAEGGKTQ